MKRNYEEIRSFDWHTIKMPRVINWITGSLIIIGIVIGQQYAPFVEFVSLIKQMPQMLLIFPLLITGYIIMHEMIHGVFMKFFSGVSPKYGFSGPFIFAKSDAYFSKNSYIILSLAPFITLGVGAALLWLIASPTGVWFAVFAGSINLFASRGDIQAAFILKDLSSDLFIKDNGDSLYIYKSVG